MKSIYRLLKINYLVKGHRLKFGAAYLAHNLGIRHLSIRFDPIMACNLRCRMCYFSNEDYVKSVRGMFTQEELERLASMLFPRALFVAYGCSTEPTLYKNFPDLVKLAKKYKVPNVSMTTNGMRLDQESIDQLIDNGLDEITISCHGTKKETYEHFMTRASYETFHNVLRMLDETKKRRRVTHPEIRFNYTVNSMNLDELREFFDIFGSYRIDRLQIRPVMDIDGEYRSPLAAGEMDKYMEIIAHLGEECRKRGITYMANTVDPSYAKPNDASIILQAIHRYVGPMNVWREDFDWRKESYDEYCKRIGYTRHLLSCAVHSLDSIVKANTGLTGEYAAKYAAKYQVNL